MDSDLAEPRLLTQALKRLGYDSFRDGQKEAVQTLIADRRLLLVAPTGGGKSLCYQLPALMFEGTTLVVSPLIALMHDQVDALCRRNVSATFFASTVDSDGMRERLKKLRRGDYKIVYAAPERLVLDGFRQLLTSINVPLIAIDEAHCISEWGHDFRPEYLKIGELLTALPDARVLACTATATPIVRDEIVARLGLDPSTPQIVRGFARPNLALSVEHVSANKDRHRSVDLALKDALGQPKRARGTAIIYAPTRKSTEEEARRLKGCGWRAEAYHAGLSPETREEVQNAFIAGSLDVAVATNAFGMGIDRSDVRAVVHLAPPGSIEAYYQEVGRAGRDGGAAMASLLISTSDLPARRGLITRPGLDGVRPAHAVVEHKWNLFLELMRWAEGGSCRHDAILRYFGDEKETLEGCGRCDVCLQLSDPAGDKSADEVTLVVRKALSAVARIHGRFGLLAAVNMLRGATDKRLARAGFEKVSTFGILREHSEAWLLALLRRCVTAGWVDFRGDDRPVTVLTASGQQVMRAQAPVRLVLPPVNVKGRAKIASTETGGRASHSGTAFAGADGKVDRARLADQDKVFETLRALRLRLAKQAQVPPYVIASDRTLRDLAALRPANVEELKLVHGLGPAKIARFGEGLLGAIANVRPSSSHIGSSPSSF